MENLEIGNMYSSNRREVVVESVHCRCKTRKQNRKTIIKIRFPLRCTMARDIPTMHNMGRFTHGIFLIEEWQLISWRFGLLYPKDSLMKKGKGPNTNVLASCPVLET